MRTIKINYIPYKKDKKGLTVKNYAFSKISQGIEILENITLLEMKTIMFLTTFQNLPTSSNKTKLRRIDTQDQIIKCINTNRKSFGDTIKSLEKKNYLVITDDEYILNVDQIEKDVQNVWENKVLSILKDDAKFELIVQQQDSLDQLERMIKAGIATPTDIEKYNELKTLLYGNNEEVEETTKETVLSDEEEIEDKATTSTIEAEEQAETEEKEEIDDEDTSNKIEVDNKEETQKEAVLKDNEEIKYKDTTSIPEAEEQPKIEQTEDEMVQEYLNRLIEPNRIQILDIKKYIYQYFQTKDPKNLIDLEYQMRLYEKAQTDNDSNKAYDQRHGYDDDIDNYDEDGNLNLMDGDINL